MCSLSFILALHTCVHQLLSVDWLSWRHVCVCLCVSHGIATVLQLSYFRFYQIVFTTIFVKYTVKGVCDAAGVVMFTNITDFCWILLQFFYVCWVGIWFYDQVHSGQAASLE